MGAGTGNWSLALAAINWANTWFIFGMFWGCCGCCCCCCCGCWACCACWGLFQKNKHSWNQNTFLKKIREMKVVPLISLLTLLTRCWSSQYIQSTSRTSLLPLEKNNYIIFENLLYDNELEQKECLNFLSIINKTFSQNFFLFPACFWASYEKVIKTSSLMSIFH